MAVTFAFTSSSLPPSPSSVTDLVNRNIRKTAVRVLSHMFPSNDNWKMSREEGIMWTARIINVIPGIIKTWPTRIIKQVQAKTIYSGPRVQPEENVSSWRKKLSQRLCQNLKQQLHLHEKSHTFLSCVARWHNAASPEIHSMAGCVGNSPQWTSIYSKDEVGMYSDVDTACSIHSLLSLTQASSLA